MTEQATRQDVERVIADAASAFTIGLIWLGDKLKLFESLCDLGPCTSLQLAEARDLEERYVREWLKGLTAATYIEYKPDSDEYFLTPAYQTLFAEEGGKLFVNGIAQFTIGSLLSIEQLQRCFEHGGGIAYGELKCDVCAGIERMHRPWFDHLLTSEWLSAVPEVQEKLQRHARILDVGCGTGRSTCALGKAYPSAHITGLDLHLPSIDEARALALEAELQNIELIAADILIYQPPNKYDLIVAIDCIHDMPQPVEALQKIRSLLAPDGLFFWSEPRGSANPMENRDLLGRFRATLSTFHCLTVSLAAGGPGLGTMIGETGVRELAAKAGFGGVANLPIDHPAQSFYLLRSEGA